MLPRSLFQYSLTFGAPNSLSFDMSNQSGLGSLSSPPYPRSSIFFEFEAPPPEAFLAPLQLPQAHPQPLPQAVVVEEAPAEDLDSTVEFYIETEDPRSEEHTSELQSQFRISYAVFCLKKKNKKITSNHTIPDT